MNVPTGASDTALFESTEGVVNQLFFTPEGRANPYPLYHQLRETRPVHRAKLGMWLLSRYDDCWAAMRDPRLGKDYAPQIEQRFGPDWRKHPSLTAGEHSMLNTSGPEHTRLRKLVTKSFTPRMIENLKPVIERVVNQLLDPVADAGGGDVLEAVGFPLPVTIIGEMLGVPEAERAQFRELVGDLVAIFEMQPTDEQMVAADAAQLTISDYFLKLIAEKRRKPGEDLLSNLALAEVGGDRLSDDELVTLASLLFGAGFETTTNLFGNGFLGLLRQPEQIELLRRDGALFANLPDEFLRYDGTAQLVNRVTEASIEVGGVTIPAGEQVFALLGAGNHDPARFPKPDQLDVTRTDIQPLSFGGGVHFCLGAALARAEIEITFRTLLQRFDHIELSGDEPRFQDRLTLRGLTALNVACRTSSGPRASVVAATAAVAVGPPAATATTEHAERGLRPRAGDTDADLRWRAELRQRIETEPARYDSVPVRTGARLAATVGLLQSNSLFACCSAQELEQLAATAYPMSFEPGDLLCSEGGESPECYIIEEGQAVVTIGRKGVATVGEHDVVGERGVLLDTVRSATVTAMSHMITYAISRERLRALVAGNAAARAWMLEEMRRRYPNLG
ncbi:MAG TPA: cytochrome P450 [Candidatus Acidoferrales bacterium]|nr:cytochrome P450 [Candidatus Acidoferrales bacterium]